MIEHVTNDVEVTVSHDFGLDKTGLTDTSIQFQKMIDAIDIMDLLQEGTIIRLPKGIYNLASTIKLKDNMYIVASKDVTIIGNGSNALFNIGNGNVFFGIEFQNCATALNGYQKKGLKVDDCIFTNKISHSAINLSASTDCTIVDSYFHDIRKYGILIDNDSADITINNNNFDNADIFGGYATEQIGGHVYCLNGTRISVTNNIIKNSGGQGIIFGYNSTTGKGVTNSVADSNQCTGNGQEGITTYGGSKKVTMGNTITNNTCVNNRFNQIEVWQSDNNIVKYNTVEESMAGTGNLGSICLFNTFGTHATNNNILSSQGNGISIIAGSSNCTVSDNFIADTNRHKDNTTPQKGNGILLDWNGIADPQYITIQNNKISSSIGTIYKSGVYSTSNTNHHNKIDSNIVTGYQYGVHWYALATCGV